MRFLLLALLVLLLPANFALAAPARLLPIAGPLEFSRDGKQLTAVWRDIVSLSLTDERITWDVATGRALHRRPFEIYTRVLHSPDGETYAKGGYQHRTFIGDDKGAIYKLSNSERICTLEAEPGEKVSPLAFSPDGQLLAARSDMPEFDVVRKGVKFWDTRTGKRLRQFEGPEGTILHAAFPADGRRVVTMEQRKADVYAVVRQRTTGKLIKTFPLKVALRLPYRYFDLSPDGRFLLTTDIDIAPLSFGGPLGTPIPTTSRNWAFMLCLWNLDTGTLAHTFLVPQFGSGFKKRRSFPVSMVMRSDTAPTYYHFSPDGTRLQIALFNRVVSGFETFVWDTQTGAQVSRRTLATTSCIDSAAFSPDGKRLALATTDGKIELRDASSLAFIRQWDVKLEGEILPPY